MTGRAGHDCINYIYRERKQFVNKASVAVVVVLYNNNNNNRQVWRSTENRLANKIYRISVYRAVISPAPAPLAQQQLPASQKRKTFVLTTITAKFSKVLLMFFFFKFRN